MAEIKAYTDGACGKSRTWRVREFIGQVKNGNTNVEEFYGSSIETTNQEWNLLLLSWL